MAGLLLSWVVLAVVCVALYTLFVAYGRLLLQVEALQGRLGARTAPQHGHDQHHAAPEQGQAHLAAPPASPISTKSLPATFHQPAAPAFVHADDDPDDADYATIAAERAGLRGLALGIPAPAFRLPRLDGGELALDVYRGRRVLLTFVDPECEACEALLPSLEAIHRGQGTGLAVLAVTRGARDRNLEMVARHGLTFPIGVQRHWDLSRQYQLFATPVAFLVDERSVIAAEPAIGAEEILRLAA